MNEFFAAEPRCISSATELRFLLKQFGPYAGRYLAAYPSFWFKDVEGIIDSWGELERARAMTALRRAKESAAILVSNSLFWDDSRSWLENIGILLAGVPRRLDGAITAVKTDSSNIPNAAPIDEFQLPPTADELISASPEELVRVCRTLLLISPELVIVDPYLDLCNQYISAVLENILAVIAKGKATRLVIWVRMSAVVSRERGVTLSRLNDELARIVNTTPLRKGFLTEVRLVEDSRSRDRMHGRYLMSIKGGVRFDQGFQKLPKGRRVEVGPIGENTHNALLNLYLAGENDLKIEHTLSQTKS